MKRIVIFIAVIAVVVQSMAIAAYADTENSIANVDASIQSSAKTVIITGNISSGMDRSVTIQVLNPQGDIDYIGQTSSTTGGAFTFNYIPSTFLEGTYTVKIGGEGIDTPYMDSFRIESEAPQNNAPVLAAIGSKTVKEKQTLVFTISAEDADKDALTFSAENIPQGSSFDPAAAKFSWTPNSSQSGEYNVKFSVTDGIDSDSETVKITVTNVSSGGGGNDDDDDEDSSPSVTPTPKPAENKVSGIFNEDDIQSAVDNAKDGVAKLEVKGAEEADEVKVVINSNILGSLKEKNVERIQVDTGIATVSINTSVLMNSEGTAPSNVELSVSKIDISGLSEEVKNLVGSNTVYDFNLSVDGKKVSSFMKDEIVISFDYTLKAGEKPGKVVVYYINDNGNLEVVTNGKYNPETRKVEFRPAHFSKYTAIYTERSFTDIGNVPWAVDSIESLAARGVINGYNNLFKPDDNVTRAEFMTMITLAFDLIDNSAVSTFNDTCESDWYYKAVASAQARRIVYGNSAVGFGPNDPITKEDIAAIIYRTALVADIKLESKNEPILFSDSSEIFDYAVEAVEVVQRAGIIYGTVGNRFAPKDNATRAETAAMIYRLFEIDR